MRPWEVKHSDGQWVSETAKTYPLQIDGFVGFLVGPATELRVVFLGRTI